MRILNFKFAALKEKTPVLFRKFLWNSVCLRKTLALGIAGLAILPASAQVGLNDYEDPRTPRTDPINYSSVINITPRQGVKGDLAPIVRIVSPLADSRVAPGEAKLGVKSPNGSGFVVNLEIVTRDRTPIRLREATLPPPGIRHVEQLNLGQPNPDAPGLYLFFDCDLITPDGTILPKFNNFASAFNIAGADDTPGDGVTAWLGWHVLESVPENVDEFTLTAAFVDERGRIGMDQIKMKVDRSRRSGQALTPAPGGPLTGNENLPNAPEVSMIAPRVPTAIALGAQDSTLNATNGSLFFIHVSAVAQSPAEIAVSETGIRDGFTNPLPVGLIFDPSQIPNPNTNPPTPAGPNRNFPGLDVTFSVPFRQANGNVVPAGVNLAPAFDIAGSEIDAQGRVRVTADWVVGGSLLLPQDQKSVTITAKVTDTLGRTGVTRNVFAVSKSQNGQILTPNPQ